MNLSTGIILGIIILICICAIISYKKKISNGCCGAGENIIKIKPKITNKKHYEYKAIVSIGGMTCQNCATRIENAFNKKGSYFAKVNLRKKSVEILSEGILTEDEVRDIIESCGYTFINMSFEK